LRQRINATFLSLNFSIRANLPEGGDAKPRIALDDSRVAEGKFGNQAFSFA
jgi:hypothetical protein